MRATSHVRHSCTAACGAAACGAAAQPRVMSHNPRLRPGGFCLTDDVAPGHTRSHQVAVTHHVLVHTHLPHPHPPPPLLQPPLSCLSPSLPPLPAIPPLLPYPPSLPPPPAGLDLSSNKLGSQGLQDHLPSTVVLNHAEVSMQEGEEVEGEGGAMRGGPAARALRHLLTHSASLTKLALAYTCGCGAHAHSCEKPFQS